MSLSRDLTPQPLARFSFLQHMAGPGGIFHGHFLGNQIYKEVPKKGEHAAMQGSARQDTLFFPLSFGVYFPISFVTRTCLLRTFHDLYPRPSSLPMDGLMSLLCLDWDSGYCDGHDKVGYSRHSGLRDLPAGPIQYSTLAC